MQPSLAKCGCASPRLTPAVLAMPMAPAAAGARGAPGAVAHSVAAAAACRLLFFLCGLTKALVWTGEELACGCLCLCTAQGDVGSPAGGRQPAFSPSKARASRGPDARSVAGRAATRALTLISAPPIERASNPHVRAPEPLPHTNPSAASNFSATANAQSRNCANATHGTMRAIH